MTNVFLNVGMVSSLIRKELMKTGDFRVTETVHADAARLADTIRLRGADMVLMNVDLQPMEATLEERQVQIRAIRDRSPGTRIFLLMNTNIGEAKLGRGVMLKQAGLIDGFLYSDCSVQYLVAMLQSMLLG